MGGAAIQVFHSRPQGFPDRLAHRDANHHNDPGRIHHMFEQEADFFHRQSPLLSFAPFLWCTDIPGRIFNQPEPLYCCSNHFAQHGPLPHGSAISNEPRTGIGNR